MAHIISIKITEFNNKDDDSIVIEGWRYLKSDIKEKIINTLKGE